MRSPAGPRCSPPWGSLRALSSGGRSPRRRLPPTLRRSAAHQSMRPFPKTSTTSGSPRVRPTVAAARNRRWQTPRPRMPRETTRRARLGAPGGGAPAGRRALRPALCRAVAAAASHAAEADKALDDVLARNPEGLSVRRARCSARRKPRNCAATMPPPPTCTTSCRRTIHRARGRARRGWRARRSRPAIASAPPKRSCGSTTSSR